MFKELKSEAELTFDMITESPLYISNGEDNSLDPSAVDGSYISIFRNGKYEPYIPGTSLKGAFRCRAERILKDGDKGACNILDREDCVKKNKYAPKEGSIRYEQSCPVCRLFGSNVLRSRVTFSDAYVDGNYKVGKRTCVAIDRITGAAKPNALYDIEYIEDAVFKGKLKLQNFEGYQIKLLLYLIEEMNDGFLTLGGLTSKGFGCMRAENLKLTLKYYGKNDGLDSKGYCNEGYYYKKVVEGFDNIMDLVKDINVGEVKRGVKFNGKAI